MKRAIVVIVLISCAVLLTPIRGIAQRTCTRADLQAAVDSYLAAQRSGSPAALPLAAPAKYIENTVDSAFDKGILKSALKIDFSRSLLDTAICESFTEVIVTDKSHPYVLGVRIKVANRRISELETLVTDADDWLFNADNYLKYSPTENWGAIPAATRDSRQTLIAAANAYFDVMDDNNVKVPWGTPCNRLEGGIRTGRGMPDSHLFRVENGKLRFVHSLTVCTVPNCGFPQRAPAAGR